MAAQNHNPVTIRMAGATLTTTDNPAALAALADVLLHAVSRSLHQQTVEGVTFEDLDRYALGELVAGARDCIRGALPVRQ